MQQKSTSNVYFTNEAHQGNFLKCMHQFKCNNREYRSTCYLAAFPEIFKCFSLENQENGPFDWYFEQMQNADSANYEGSIKGNTAPLTSQTNALVHLALNLWNGNKFDLADGLSIWDTDLYKVALQAIDLRRREQELIVQ
ncbi:hypothetical protein ABEW34_12170 [Paenibacillus algorifonticola]|uniref:hypothetical protein n=1 Tax=Paenibacillus algorifonticola TaxID=684063 RepID=UPI003D297623